MYIVQRTSDANPVSGPMSYLLNTIQKIRRKTILSSSSRTHKYEGGIAEMRVKKVMTRHESRRPSPKAAGPNAPEENLRIGPNHSVRLTSVIQGKRHTHGRMFAFAENHTKKTLMKYVSVLSIASTGRIPIKLQVGEWGQRSPISSRVA